MKYFYISKSPNLNIIKFLLILWSINLFPQIGNIGYDVSSYLNPIKLNASSNDLPLYTFAPVTNVQFVLPEGWETPELLNCYDYEELKTFRSWFNSKKGQIWALARFTESVSTYDADKWIFDKVLAIAPLNQHIETYKINQKKEKNRIVYIWDAKEILDGKEHSFKVFGAFQEKGFSGFYQPILIGRSNNENSYEAMKEDFLIMAEHLSHYDKKKYKGDVLISEKGKSVSSLSGSITKSLFVLSELKKLKESNTSSIDQLFPFEFQNKKDWISGEYYLPSSNILWKSPSIYNEGKKSSSSFEKLLSDNMPIDAIQIGNNLFIIYTNGMTMTDIKTGNLLWYKDKNILFNNLEFISSDDDNIYLLNKGFKGGIESYNINNGDLVSSKEVEITPDRFLFDISSEGLLLVKENDKDTDLVLYNLKKGEKLWAQKIEHKNDPDKFTFVRVIGDNVMIVRDGIELRTISNGDILWNQKEIKLSEKSPDPLFFENEVILIDKHNKLNIVDLETGDISKTMPLDDSYEYSNLQAGDDNIYVRSNSKPNKNNSVQYSITAINGKSLEPLWVFSDTIPTTSNFVIDESKVYVANWRGPMAFNKETGELIFKIDISEHGKTYPVKLLKYNENLVYHGELTIAGIDPKTGSVVYHHDFSPISQSMHLDAIDPWIEAQIEYLKPFGKPALQGLNVDINSNYSINTAQESQARSNQYAYNARNQFAMANYYSGTSTGVAYYNQAKINYMKSQISSSISKAQMQGFQMMDAVERLAKYVAENTSHERKRVRSLKQMKKKLLEAYDYQLFGEYSVRITEKNKSGENGKQIKVIHLPTGQIKADFFEPFMGGFVFVNPIENQVYYNSKQPVFETSNDSDEPKLALYGNYLVAKELNDNKISYSN